MKTVSCPYCGSQAELKDAFAVYRRLGYGMVYICPDESCDAYVGVHEGTDKPKGSLGRIEDIAAWLARWTGRAPPSVLKPMVAIFAGNHGVAAQGVSPRAMEATAQRVELCAARRAAHKQKRISK